MLYLFTSQNKCANVQNLQHFHANCQNVLVFSPSIERYDRVFREHSWWVLFYVFCTIHEMTNYMSFLVNSVNSIRHNIGIYFFSTHKLSQPLHFKCFLDELDSIYKMLGTSKNKCPVPPKINFMTWIPWTFFFFVFLLFISDR